MLKNAAFRHRQQGVVLFLALVVLVAMLLSGLALFRSVDSGVLVAGNLAKQKSATRQGDQGTEAAITWLDANKANGVLHANAPGYVANGLNDSPAGGTTWVAWWDTYTATRPPVSLPADVNTGNTVSYLIQRLCSQAGAPYQGATTCAGPPPPPAGAPPPPGSSMSLLPTPPPTPSSLAVYYRITSRIVGPRNTVSFVQAIISL